MSIRAADFAGSWYPGSERLCREAIEEFMSERLPCPGSPGRSTGAPEGFSPLGGIVPHAGWLYSGKTAFSVIKCLGEKGPPDLCILFGRHLPPGGEAYMMKEGAWETPLGPIEIDAEVAGRLASEFVFTIETSKQYDPDNTIELQLPFLKYLFPEVRIVPMGLPPVTASLTVARRAAELSLATGRKTVVLGSTDLTHYGPNYANTPVGTGREAVRWVKEINDRRVVNLMVELNEEEVIREALRNQNACCPGAASASIAACKVLGARKGEEIGYHTSYDIHPGSSFVGYVGVLFGG